MTDSDSVMRNDNDNDNMDNDKGSNGSNFDDFEDFDGYERQLDDDDKKEDGNDLGKDFTMDDFDEMFDKDSEIVQDGDADDCEDFKFQTQVIIKCEEKNSTLHEKLYAGFFSHHFVFVVTWCCCLVPQCSA